jgi:hypothetical protein
MLGKAHALWQDDAEAVAAGSLCPAEKDLNMLHAMISKGFEDLQHARACRTTH